uniref:Uncharacterized protein n=1 Tax=Physcomitrium patens TaxID=3218 RepID=A0A2K1K1R7_PHYPA|nr:hypothetical protein PHYPA_012196 [Physcomitrium patens]
MGRCRRRTSTWSNSFCDEITKASDSQSMSKARSQVIIYATITSSQFRAPRVLKTLVQVSPNHPKRLFLRIAASALPSNQASIEHFGP